jgi:hypothetical protein
VGLTVFVCVLVPDTLEVRLGLTEGVLVLEVVTEGVLDFEGVTEGVLDLEEVPDLDPVPEGVGVPDRVGDTDVDLLGVLDGVVP